MKVSTPEKVWFGVTLITIFWVLILVTDVYASGDCKGHSCGGETTVDTDVTVGGTNINIGDTNVPIVTGANTQSNSTTIEGSRAYALSNSLGDVDIAGCLGSTQWATPLFSKQKLVVNWPCLTEFYLRNAQFELASMAICNTEIRKEFASEQACRDAHAFEPMLEEPVMVMEQDDDEVEYLRDELEEQAMLQADLNAKIQNLERSQRVVIREPYLSDEQKTKLREVKQ